jgi:hypothetical protein
MSKETESNEDKELGLFFEEFDLGEPEVSTEASEEADEPETPAAEEEKVEEPSVETTSEEDEKPEEAVEEVKAEEEPEKEEEPETEEESSVVDDIKTAFGYEIEGEFEDTTEGLTELTGKIAEKIAEEQLDGIFNQHPTIQKHLEFVRNGGNPEDFMRAFAPEVDYGKIELKDEDTEAQKAVLRDYFTAKGNEAEFANDMIEAYEDKGVLKERATSAKNALAGAQEARREKLMESQRAEQAWIQAENDKMWREIQDTINNSDDLNGVKIPKASKGKFIDYISKPINKQGMTARDKAYAEAPIETQLALDYILFSGMKFGEIVDKKANTAAAKTLQSKLRKKEATATNKQKRVPEHQTDSFEDLDLDFLE